MSGTKAKTSVKILDYNDNFSACTQIIPNNST